MLGYDDPSASVTPQPMIPGSTGSTNPGEGVGGNVALAAAKPKGPGVEDEEPSQSEIAMVKMWQSRITQAKRKWESEFDRMRENMDFVYGIQYKGQTNLSGEDRYICNLTLRTINQGVAMIYARDPRVEARRRPRMDYQVWDGKMETIQQVAAMASQAQMMGGMVPPQFMALINDFTQGTLHRELVRKVGDSLETVFQYQMDTQSPSFKLQMKQLVRRVRVCGVGYVKVEFCRNYENDLTQSETRMSVADRMKRAKYIFECIEKGSVDEMSPELEELKSLIASLQTAPLDAEAVKVTEHLTFDFPRATSIIPDPNTRMLKGFVGAHWVVEECYYPLEFVNAYFECDIKPGGELQFYGRGGKPDEGYLESGENQDNKKKKVCLWTVWNLDTKSTFILCQGHKKYVVPPEPVTPATKGFWNIVPVTFNDIEVEDGCKATIFPPSDVDLIKSAQKEWNRTRQALRRHRKANAPRYLYPDGSISEEDLDRVENAEDQQFVKIKGLMPGAKPTDIIQALKTEPINESLYNTEPLREDTLLATGQQEANIGPAQPNVTATTSTIAEQSRMTVSSSDSDGLDDSLTEVAKIGGEMLLKEMSVQTVKHIAGVGAVWPDQNREDFINEIELQVVAASSGRPNKAVEIANWGQIAPLLMQAGANPQAVIRETVKRADDRLEPADFFPLPLPMMQPPGALGEGDPSAQGQPGPPNDEGQGQMMPNSAAEPTQPNPT